MTSDEDRAERRDTEARDAETESRSTGGYDGQPSRPAPSAFGARRDTPSGAPRRATQYGVPQRSSSYEAQPSSPPQVIAPRHPARPSAQPPTSATPTASEPPASGAPQPQSQPPQRYAPPRYAPPASAPAVYAHPHHGGRDAPLIHPAAAQASNATLHGVPVYHAPVYAVAAPPSRGLSITAMVLGLISVTFGWTLVVLPLIGLVFGFLALRREPAGRGMAITGLITSGVGVLWVLLFYLLPLLGVLAAMLFAVSASP